MRTVRCSSHLEGGVGVSAWRGVYTSPTLDRQASVKHNLSATTIGDGDYG